MVRRLLLSALAPLGFARKATTDRWALILSIRPSPHPSHLLSVTAALDAFSAVSHLKTKGISRALLSFDHTSYLLW